MSSETQLDSEWAVLDAVQEGSGLSSPNGGYGGQRGARGEGADRPPRYLSDEEILEMDAPVTGAPSHSFAIPSEARNLSGGVAPGQENLQRDSSGITRPQNDSEGKRSAGVADHASPERSANGARGMDHASPERSASESRGMDHASPEPNASESRGMDRASPEPNASESRGMDHASPERSASGAQRANAESQATGHDSRVTASAMPAWMAAAATDPQHAAEAQELWREHQEFRAAFASPDEARAVKELLPGGVRDVLALREATQSVERIDAALFSGDARAQAEVVAELARANPAAFRSLFAEAARFLTGANAGREAGGVEAGRREARTLDGEWQVTSPPVRQASGQQDPSHSRFVIPSEAGNLSENLSARGENRQRDSSGSTRPQNDSLKQRPAGVTTREPRIANHDAGSTDHQSEVGHRESRITTRESPPFDAAAYAAFERATNDAVARDVRGTIGETLSRVLPEGTAEGAARRIGDDIFQEIHRALAADRTLSEQVAAVLRQPGVMGDPSSPGLTRFGAGEQERVAALLAGRARQLVPSVARRVISEWTSSVLNTSRAKAARQAAASSRVDIASPGGGSGLGGASLRSRSRVAGARDGSQREVDYASLTDEEILGI